MSATINLKGRRFGRLVAVEITEERRDNKRCWRCVCDCGAEKVVASRLLTSGKTTSCGCFQRESSRERRTTHGGCEMPTYQSWRAMRGRCLNPNSKTYSYYGGRGVTICDRWNSFENFLSDMGERPEGKTLDRYPDPAGNYEPGNCRWATKTEQSRNQRRFAEVLSKS